MWKKFSPNIPFLIFLILEPMTIASSEYSNNDSCDVPRELVHPFLKQIQKANTQRYKYFDQEDIKAYLEVSFSTKVIKNNSTCFILDCQRGHPHGGLLEGQTIVHGWWKRRLLQKSRYHSSVLHTEKCARLSHAESQSWLHSPSWWVCYIHSIHLHTYYNYVHYMYKSESISNLLYLDQWFWIRRMLCMS